MPCPSESYTWDAIPGDGISAGGGQMTTCSDLLRLGQVLLNKGKWLEASGCVRACARTFVCVRQSK